MRDPQLRAALAALCVGCLLAACSAGPGAPSPTVGSTTPSAAAAAPVSNPVAGTIQPVLVSTQAWPGPNRILLTIEDAQNRELTAPDLAVRGTFRELGGSSAAAPIDAVGSYVRVVQGGRGLIELDAVLPRAGRWRLDVRAVPASATPLTGSTEVVVRPDGGTPAIGAKAPDVPTPTAKDVGYDLARLTSDPIPEKSLYWLSAAQALAAHHPFVLVLDSFKFKVSGSCGGALGLVRHLGEAFPTISFIHAEPYRTTFSGGELTLDPPGGPGRLAAWSNAWGIDDPPWVFVVDETGVVRAKFSGVFGTEELRAALRPIAGWTPST
jgi:hypothetical protein